jgi:anti-sigma regulatory factor (Ser/Thr protein kinase)
MKEIIVPANPDNIAIVTEYINAELEAAGCSEHDRVQIDVAVDEVFGNIAKYAYGREEGTATIRVEVSGDPSAVSITFIDHGIPYNPLENKAPDTTLKAKDRRIGGLGVFITKRIMSDVNYEYIDESNQLTIRKVIG